MMGSSKGELSTEMTAERPRIFPCSIAKTPRAPRTSPQDAIVWLLHNVLGLCSVSYRLEAVAAGGSKPRPSTSSFRIFSCGSSRVGDGCRRAAMHPRTCRAIPSLQPRAVEISRPMGIASFECAYPCCGFPLTVFEVAADREVCQAVRHTLFGGEGRFSYPATEAQQKSRQQDRTAEPSPVPCNSVMAPTCINVIEV